MRDQAKIQETQISEQQARRLQEAVENLFACCQARIAMQSAHFNLPPAALRALVALGETPCLAPGELGRRLGVTKSRVTAVTTGLSHQGLIEKRHDPADARVSLLSLTPAGKQACEEIRVFMTGLFASILGLVEPEKREAVLVSLESLRRCMDTVRADLSR